MDTEKCQCNLCDMIEHTTWVNVKDRLPNEEEECLVCSEDNLYALAAYLNKKWSPFCGHEFDKMKFKVMAWMPLPNAPRRKNKEL